MSGLIGSFALFPTYALRKLGGMRGRKWASLVESIADIAEDHPRHLAYTLMMRRLSHLVGSDKKHLCFVPSCVSCATELLSVYEGNERDLLNEYNRALNEVENYLTRLEDVRKAA